MFFFISNIISKTIRVGIYVLRIKLTNYIIQIELGIIKVPLKKSRNAPICPKVYENYNH